MQRASLSRPRSSSHSQAVRARRRNGIGAGSVGRRALDRVRAGVARRSLFIVAARDGHGERRDSPVFHRSRRRHQGYGALQALLGGGGLLGAAIAARMPSASCAPLIVTVTFAVGPRPPARRACARTAVALAGMAIAGAGRGVGDAADMTLVQARAQRPRSSRVFAAQDGAAHAAYSAANARGGGLIVATAGARAAVVTAGGCGLAASLVASRMLRGRRIAT